jgi:hypothetical protein
LESMVKRYAPRSVRMEDALCHRLGMCVRCLVVNCLEHVTVTSSLSLWLIALKDRKKLQAMDDGICLPVRAKE